MLRSVTMIQFIKGTYFFTILLYSANGNTLNGLYGRILDEAYAQKYGCRAVK